MENKIIIIIKIMLQVIGYTLLFMVDWKIATGVFLVTWGMNIKLIGS